MAGRHFEFDAVEDDRRHAVHDEPVLGATRVSLIAEALARVDDEALYLVVEQFIVKYRERAPRPFIDFASASV
jgi:hypothetical protein